MIRPTFQSRIDLRAIASMILYWEHLEESSGEHVIPPTLSGVISLIVEKAAYDVVARLPKYKVESMEDAMHVIRSRGLRVPQWRRTTAFMVKALQEEADKGE